jgi:hypothetical protein
VSLLSLSLSLFFFFFKESLLLGRLILHQAYVCCLCLSELRLHLSVVYAGEFDRLQEFFRFQTEPGPKRLPRGRQLGKLISSDGRNRAALMC